MALQDPACTFVLCPAGPDTLTDGDAKDRVLRSVAVMWLIGTMRGTPQGFSVSLTAIPTRFVPKRGDCGTAESPNGWDTYRILTGGGESEEATSQLLQRQKLSVLNRVQCCWRRLITEESPTERSGSPRAATALFCCRFWGTLRTRARAAHPWGPLDLSVSVRLVPQPTSGVSMTGTRIQRFAPAGSQSRRLADGNDGAPHIVRHVKVELVAMSADLAN